MFKTKHYQGIVPFGDFLRMESGDVIYYEVTGGDISRAMNAMNSHMNQGDGKAILKALHMVDIKEGTLTPFIRAELIRPAAPREKVGAKTGAKRKGAKTRSEGEENKPDFQGEA